MNQLLKAMQLVDLVSKEASTFLPRYLFTVERVGPGGYHEQYTNAQKQQPASSKLGSEH